MVNGVFAKIDESTASVLAVTSISRPEIKRTVDDINDAYSDCFIKLYGSLAPQVFDVIKTQAGVASYDIDSHTDINATMLVSIMEPNTVQIPLVESNLEILSRNNPLNVQGQPLNWYRYMDKLTFYPVPDKEYSIRVVSALKYKPLSAGTDTSILPDIHDKLLRFYAIATAKAFWKDGDAGDFYQKYKDGLDDLLAEAIRKGPRRVIRMDTGDGELEPLQTFNGSDHDFV
jgi:hypothetical protein